MNYELIYDLVSKADKDFQLALLPADIVEKFVELIVKECADISDASFHNGSAGYLAILKHFGVEKWG